MGWAVQIEADQSSDRDTAEFYKEDTKVISILYRGMTVNTQS